MRAKEKASPYGVPQSREQAVSAIAEIGRRQREVTRLETAMNDEMSVIKARYEEAARPHGAAIEALTHGVRIWCEANRDALTQGGKVKSASLETGVVSWRTTPPKVVTRGVEAVLDQLRRLGLTRFIREKEELNKEAILNEPEAIVAIKGLSISQSEDFEVKPFEEALSEAAV